MDFNQAQAADVLWGWPVGLLDRLFELRARAGAGSLGIEEWREQDAALRTGMPEVDLDEVVAFQTDWLVNGSDLEVPLTDRLTALTSPPPTDEELRHEIAEADVALADRRTARRLKDAYRARRARAAAWLTRPGGGLDPVTGLPWSTIERYRVIDDPDVGPVPQHVGVARQLALRDASDAERDAAALVAAGQDKLNLEFDAAKADMQQRRMMWFPGLLKAGVQADEGMRPLAEELSRIWSDPRVQRLLLEETSVGWPEPIEEHRG
ncbi:hypothetical protein ACFORO_34055 [Amycolatopsis halotolerans]|uniref:Uncharacterized protein n=1 Tax=Amycolatopsis halotolerans TaxID=330083 RepID=A0ABV7QPL6_9PSEU